MPQREYPSAPLVGVGAVIVDDQGRVLLIQRGTEPRKGLWSIPGGLVELGEGLPEAVQREVLEETGLHIRPEAVVEVVDRIYPVDGPKGKRIRYHYVLVDYWCSLAPGQTSDNAIPSSDAADLCWITPAGWNEIDGVNPYALEPVTIQIIEKGWQMAKMAGVHG